MNFEEYRVAAMRSMSHGDDFNLRQAVWALGLAGEAGEVAGVLLDSDPDLPKLSKEIGDTTWYIAAICTHNGWSLAEIAGVDSIRAYTSSEDVYAAAGPSWGTHLFIKAAALADYVKKVVGHGHPLDVYTLKALLGAVLVTLRTLCAVYGVDLEKVCEANIAKLNARYPQGFTTADSLARRDVETT